MTTLNVVAIPAEQRAAACERVAGILLPYVKDAAHSRLGPLKFTLVSPVLAELLVEIVVGIIAFAVPALAPFAPLILEAVRLIDVSHLSEDAKAVLEILLGMLKH